MTLGCFSILYSYLSLNFSKTTLAVSLTTLSFGLSVLPSLFVNITRTIGFDSPLGYTKATSFLDA